MSASPPSGAMARWSQRIAGLAVFFLFAAAPLPGETPGCEAAGAVDDSAALLGDGAPQPDFRNGPSSRGGKTT